MERITYMPSFLSTLHTIRRYYARLMFQGLKQGDKHPGLWSKSKSKAYNTYIAPQAYGVWHVYLRYVRWPCERLMR